MTDTGQLLRLIHGIADPCEAIRSRAMIVSKDPAVPADIRQATADLGKAIEHVFEVASYIIERESNLR
jgi:hypothetical protein